MLRCNCINLAELVRKKSSELRTNARFLAAQAAVLLPAKPGKFTQLQQALGLTYHKHALLLDTELDDVFDPRKTYQHDNIHGLWVDGAVNLVIYLLFEVFIRHLGMNVYSTFTDFASNWTWPSRLGSNMNIHLAEIFTAALAEKHRKTNTSTVKHRNCYR